MSEARAVLVLGGAGFIGSHLVRRLLEGGRPVVLFDNLSRPGGDGVVRRLRAEYGDLLEVVIGDVRDRTALRRAVGRATGIVHLAGRFGDAGAVADPHLDFEINLRATVDLLEELRRAERPIPLVHGSTSKVYGALRKLQLREMATRYAPVNEWVAVHGLDEHWPLEVASPYGCSRAAADQYVLEYARSYSLPALVARIGCVYGPEQRSGDQLGWISQMMARALAGQPVAVDGDGKQVRDVLHVGDAVEALCLLLERMEDCAGHVFNVGGGPSRAVSVRELLDLIGRVAGLPVEGGYGDWREGDPRYFVANTSKLEAMTGWQPAVGLAAGLRELESWLQGGRPAGVVEAGAAAGLGAGGM